MATVMGHGPTRGYFPGAIDGARIGWFAPTFKILEDIWNDLKRATYDAALKVSESTNRIWFHGGGSVEVRSADNPDTASRGPGWDGAVIDEATLTKKRMWTECIRPALADKKGWLMILTTPRGHDWIKELWDSVPTRNDWERWRFPSTVNPLMTQEELDNALLDGGPRAYAQEYLAEFCDVEGSEFPSEYFRDSLWFDEWPPLDSFAYRVIGVDPSKGKSDKSDFSAFCMIGLDHAGDLWVDCDMERRDINRIMVDGVRLSKWFNPNGVAFEGNMFQDVLGGIFQQVCREASYMIPLHLIYHSSRASKPTRIRETLTPFLARGEIHFRRSKGGYALVEQLRDFPQGRNDDGPDALEMGIRLMKKLFAGGGSADPEMEPQFEGVYA